MDDSPNKSSWLDRLTAFLLREPEDRDELVEVLHTAFERHLLDADALAMIEGVLQVSDIRVGDIMVPRAQMDVIDISTPVEEFLPSVIEKAHSRFPVIDGERDKVIGILLAKDLLRLYAGQDESIRDMLRPAVFIPESKRLNVLLKDFRLNRNHLAIVVDEYGGVAGLVTIEDVMEQIVGDIEDEYDYEEFDDQIQQEHDNCWRVQADITLEEFNEHFDAQLVDEEHATLAGMVIAGFGHMPKRGEQLELNRWRIEVLKADSRRLHSLRVYRTPGAKK